MNKDYPITKLAIKQKVKDGIEEWLKDNKVTKLPTGVKREKAQGFNNRTEKENETARKRSLKNRFNR